MSADRQDGVMWLSNKQNIILWLVFSADQVVSGKMWEQENLNIYNLQMRNSYLIKGGK